MKNKVLVIALALVLVFSCTAAAFADSGIQPRETVGVDFFIERTSGTTADVDVVVHFSSTADGYSVVVYLQKLVNGVWKNDSTNPDYVFYNNDSNSNLCMFSHLYTTLEYGTSYRIMVISRDLQGSNEYRTTTYSNSF